MPRITLHTDRSGMQLGESGRSFWAWTDGNDSHEVIFTVETTDIRDFVSGNREYRINSGASTIRWNDGNEEDNVMSVKEKFFMEKIQKSAGSLKGIAGLITQSFEVESMTKYQADHIKNVTLKNIDGGQATSKQVNDGNGWNKDTHLDGSLSYYSADNGGIHGTETSASPIDLMSYADIKNYLTRIIKTYREATGGVYHTSSGSTHVHNTVAYIKEGFRDVTSSVEVDNQKVYNNVARFFLKFMPVMKWLSMTNRNGGRRVEGSSYDTMASDELFYWWSSYNGSMSSDSMDYLRSMQRESYLRIMGNNGQVHFENRMCDCTLDETHLAMWLSINKAITLLAIDFARKDYLLTLSSDEVSHTKRMMYDHMNSYRDVSKTDLKKMYKEFVSYLVKYLKIIGSLETIEVMDKLIEKPISQYVFENSLDRHWNTEEIYKVFNTRNRASDTVLRDSFMKAIQFLEVDCADSLNDFHDNMASHLDVEVKKVKSLYQMFKKENVDIEFLGGRLVYLGD